MLFDTIDEAITERIFYNLLLRVGALGKYQYIALIIWSVIYMMAASSMFFNPFLFYQAPYVCTDLNQPECFIMVCSLPQDLRSGYLDLDHITLFDQFGDYRCENSSFVKYLQSIIYVSGVVGIILGTFLNSFIRKKQLLEVSLAVSIVCLSLALLVSDLIVMMILLCLNFFCQSIIADLAVCFLTQTVLEEERGSHMMVMFIFYSVGCVANGLLFKLLPWQQVFLFYFIVPMALAMLGLIFYIKETPFDLVTSRTPEEAYEQLHWMAEQNGNADSHEITIKEIRQMRAQYQSSLEKKQQANFSMINLFTFKSLRMDTICCCVFHFFIYYNYSAPLLALDQFSSDLYVNDIVFSTGTLCSAIVCFYLIGDLPRKKMVYFSTALSFIFVVPQYFASNCKDNCESVKIVETISMFIFRVLLEVSYQTFYFIQNEIFPTQIRTLAILFTAITSNTVTIFIPLVADFNETHNYFLPCSFIVSGIFVMAATSQLRETLGVPPPEIIEELAYTPNQKQGDSP